MSRAVLLIASALSAAGCSSITGLTGGSGYACKAPEGVACDSMSGVYANSMADRLPARLGTAVPPAPAPQAAPRMSTAPRVPVAAPSLRSAARVLRLWVKPWEDADGDLIDQGFVYVQVDHGQWLIDHAHRQIREAYAPVKAPPRLPGSGAPKEAAGSPQRPPAPAVPKGAALPRPPAASDQED